MKKKKKSTKKVSMQTIADAAGVARSTVSFALNGKEKEGRISKDMAEKIREIAESMNYQVNELARSLRTGLTYTIALVVDDISDIFFATMAFHLQKYAESKGYLLIIVGTGYKQDHLESMFNMLRKRQVDGVIIVPMANIEEGVIEKINPGIPMVFVDRYFQTLKTSRVCINNYQVSKLATQTLIDKGCKRIIFISYRESLMHLQDRKQGYMDTLRFHKFLDRALICEVDYHNRQEEITAFLKEHFATNRNIDGIFTATGGISSIAIRCLLNMGINLQTDVQVIAFGRVDVAAGVSIPFVKQPLEEMCKQSFDILMNRIKAPEAKEVDCVVDASIVTENHQE